MSTQQVTMTTQQVADRLHELCERGAYSTAHNELYAQEAISLEPAHYPEGPAHGLDAIKKKGEQFQQSIQQVHGGYVSKPLVAGNHITMTLGLDVTMKDGQRFNMDEVCVYEVKDGKIVKEQFFF